MKLHCQKLRLMMFIARAIYNTSMKAKPLEKSSKTPVTWSHINSLGELDPVRKSGLCSSLITLETFRAMSIHRSGSTSEVCIRQRHSSQKLWQNSHRFS